MDSFQVKINNFHPIKSANLAAALLVSPKFHANTFRIEALVHYILANCKGTRLPAPKIIEKWLNDFEPISSMAYMEDPIEDVFVTKILTKWGDFRIYEGIWEANDFCLQKILDTIKSIPTRYDIDSLFNPIRSLLSISEEVARRNKASLYQLANSNDKVVVHVPSSDALKRLAKTLVFTKAQIQKMGLTLNDIGPFIFDPNLRDNLNHQTAGNTDLERFPLLYDGHKVILVLPTAVSVATRRFVFEWLYQNGLINSFEKNLVGEYIRFLHETPILGKPFPPNLPIHPQKISEAYFFEATTEIENGRFLHVLVRVDTLHGFIEDGMDAPAPYSQEQIEEIERRIQNVKNTFQSKDDFREGLSLVISCGYGRPYFGMLSEEISDWNVELISAHDLETIGWVPGASDYALWKLLEQKRKLEEIGVEFMYANGLLNLYGWWEQSDHVLIPDGVEIGQGPWVINFPTDCLAKVRQKTREASDFHTEAYVDGKYKRVRRKHLSSLFLEDRNEPLYASYGDIHTTRLLGCAVTKTRAWWVRLNRNNTELDMDVQFRIWDAMHNWMERISKKLDKKFPKLSIGPVQFLIDLSALPLYEQLPEDPPPASDKIIEIQVDRARNTVKLKLKETFLYNLHNPINISERELVNYCVKGFIDLIEVELDESEVEKICDEVVPNQDARYMHFFKANYFRDHIRAFDKCEYTIIDASDAGLVKINLGHIEGETRPREINGKTECTAFLNKVVAHSWEKLKIELKKYQRESLITAALRNIEGIAGEKAKWNRTARAVISLHEDEEDVHRAKIQHFSSLYAADMASRILIEMAVCECPIESGLEVGSLDLSTLMAKASLIFHLGNSSDAIDKGVAELRVVVAGNGDVKTDYTFHDEIIMPYTKDFEKISFADSAKKYEIHFEEASPPSSPSEVFQDDFLKAFEDEFGIAFEHIRNFKEEMENMATEKQKSVFTVTKEEILEYCDKGSLCNKEQAIKALEGFSLEPRENWEKPKTGYKSRDISPWLFRRRLSLLQKPYVKIENINNPRYVISPGISYIALAYTLDTYLSCNIEADRCRSQKMKKWIGKESARKGHAFNKKVAATLQSIGYQVHPDVEVSSIISKKKLNRNYGDIDVLAWKDGEQSIYAIECKDLYHAKTIKEVAEQILEFQGEARKGKPDRLKKHMNRIEILSQNKEDLKKFCGITTADFSIIPYIVFSNPVPMMYDNSILNKVNISSIMEIEKMNGFGVRS